MWVFTYKFNKDGYLTKYKARCVARGDLQLPYRDTYAATLAAKTFHALIAIINYFSLVALQYDAPYAFLNALINRKLYVETPHMFKRQDGSLLRVLRALYGLKESPLL
jgi:hypothetical protein